MMGADYIHRVGDLTHPCLVRSVETMPRGTPVDPERTPGLLALDGVVRVTLECGSSFLSSRIGFGRTTPWVAGDLAQCGCGR